ncbi:MAG: hypothetical protein H6564_03940 [Lewinellaceae bacterium]|nr:hypothetical protein [Lewinellaceae bacterium]
MQIKNLLLFAAYAMAVSLSACKGNAPQAEGQQILPPKATAPEPGVVFTDASLLPPGVVFDGQFLQGVHWEEQGSSYYGLVSKYQQGEFFKPGWVSRLHLYLFELNNGQVISHKAFVAEAPNIYSEAGLNAERTKVVNLPSLGQAIALTYSICPDGEDPCTFYATVFNDKGKYDFQAMENVDKAVYFEARADIMQGIPDDVQLQLLAQLFPN